MTTRRRTTRLAAASLGVLAIGASSALAGGFAIREQSSEYQGMSFAGNAAGGGGLSGMFWNPAVAGQFNGLQTESHYAFILPSAEATAQAGSSAGLLALGSTSGEIGNSALVGASYLTYQLSPHIVFGFSFNAPFGLATEPANGDWAGSNFGRTSSIKTYSGQAVLAYRVSSNVIVGAGLVIEHIDATIKSAALALQGAPSGVVKGDDTNVGWTLGAVWNPSRSTSLGLGYRSKIDHNLEGSASLTGPLPASAGIPSAAQGAASIRAPITLPDMATFSVRQSLNDRFAVLGSVEWTGWSRVDGLRVYCTSGSGASAAVGCASVGALQQNLPLNWHDGWFVSGGVEYKYDAKTTLRTGVAWEKSPIQNATERPTRLPDADRVWLSLGGTYKWSEKMSFDVAYSHVFVQDASIDRFAKYDAAGVGSGNHLLADVSSSVDILTASMKIKFGGETPVYEPMK